MLGVELLPWQRQVFDVALEHNADGSLVYREVVVTVARQSGKTLALLALVAHRLTVMAERLTPVLTAMGRPDRSQRVYTTAQTGQDSRSKFRDDWLPMFESTPMSQFLVKKRLSNGTELLEFADSKTPATRTWHGVIAPLPSTPTAGHGKVTDLGILDEAFADIDDRREQALRPGMNTRPSPQLWVVSTAGDANSTYLRRKVDRCRVGVETDALHTTAYFEWSADADADADDEEVWRSCMPALGAVTPVEAIRSAREGMSDGEFRRAYLNQWVEGSEKVIPMDAWLRCESSAVAPRGDNLVYALDANPLRDRCSLAVSDGDVVELIATYDRDGFDRAVADAVTVSTRDGQWGRVVVDAGSPMGSKIDELRRAGAHVVELSFSDVKTACGEMFDAVVQRRVGIVPNDDLRAAAEGARRKMVGDRFVWSRTHPTVDLTPLTAVTFARHNAQQKGIGWLPY